MNARLKVFAIMTVTCVSLPASGSWLSDFTGINIDVARVAAQAVATPPSSAIIATLPTNAGAAPPITAPVEPKLVPQKDRDTLVSTVGEFDSATARVSRIYENILFGVTLGSIALGLCASIAGFCKQSTLAGILSIIAAGILGIGSALPIAQNADFYRLLAAQSQALHYDAELHQQMTVSEYDGFRDGLKTLVLFEGQKFPSRSGTQEATQTLIAQLKAVRTDLPRREGAVSVN